MGTKRKYNYSLIEKLCKKQPKNNFNATDVAKRYCKQEGIEFSVYIARRVQQIISDNDLHIDSVDPKKSIQYTNATKRSYKSKKKNVIVTWAQAKTPIHKKLWENILAYADKTNSEIIVIPGTYLNPNSPHSIQAYREFAWDQRLTEYLYATECQIHNHLITIADTDIVPTAKTPLTGFHSVTGIESCIIGHPRQHMDMVATMKNSRRKFMFSTGAITVPNYRIARAGKEASIHHKMGFLFIESISADNFVARHVHAEDNGAFQDLTFRVEGGRVLDKKEDLEAMIFGDTHLKKEDKTLLNESKRIVKLSNCKRTVWHDLMDGYSINPHEAKDYVEQVIKTKRGDNLLSEELEYNKEFVREWIWSNMVVVPSNHPEWIDRWVRENRGVKDPANAILFNEFQNVLFNEDAPKGLYAYYLEKEFGDKINCLSRDDSYEVCGIELNNHGDLGSNGAKGTPLTFKKLNTPIVSGDKHWPYTFDNAHGVGLSSVLDHKYNRGMSSWAQSNGIILSNGRFQHLMYFEGKFTNLI